MMHIPQVNRTSACWLWCFLVSHVNYLYHN